MAIMTSEVTDADIEKIKRHSGITFVPGKSDADLAKEYRERVIEALKPILVLLDEANKNQMRISFNCGTSAFGSAFVQSIEIVKIL